MENKINITGKITGTNTETENRIKSDQSLLNTIENERSERIEIDNDIIDLIDDLSKKYFIISKRLNKYEIALNFVIGLSVGLLISMIFITLKMLN